MRPVATIVGVPSEDFDIPSEPILTGRLNNSEYLLHLDSQLGYLPKTVQTDLMELFNSHLSLFSDTPSCTNMIEHDIDVGEAKLIKQHFQRMPMGKRKRMEKEVEYMLKNGIAEPACSSWASPCLLADKDDGSDRFCTDFRKVNAVTKPDCYPMPRMEDCIDQVGSAKFVTKLHLLKGYWQVPLTARARHVVIHHTLGIVFLFCNAFWFEKCSRDISAPYE